jgi:hypothetical protein
MLRFTDSETEQRLRKETGAGADCAGQVLQLHRCRGEHQGADSEGQVTSMDLAGRSGQEFVYDVHTGRLSEVLPDRETNTG